MTTIAVDRQAAACPGTASTAYFSKPGHVDLVVYRGDSGRLRVHATQADGSDADLAGAVWTAQIRADADATDALVELDVWNVDVSTVDVTLTAEQSATLPAQAVWDLQVVLGTSTATLLAGTVTTRPDVTR